jgi:hypothetical protein
MCSRGAAVVAIVVLGVSGCSTAGNATHVSPSSNARPSRSHTATPRPTPHPVASVRAGAVTKLLVFIEENHSLNQMKSNMPYAFGLAQRFGYATGYTAIGHPSLPNYIAIAGGLTYGINDDDNPSAHPVRGPSVFGQAFASGKAAAVYVDGMPQNCATSNGGSGYAVKHNPWAYFTNERDICQKHDLPADQLPLAITQGALPNLGMVIPNLCHDAHDCPLATADTWFKAWMTKLFQGPDWRSGHLAIVLTADEDDKSAGNNVLTVDIHPSQKANVVTSPLTHYSLTRLYEEVARTGFLFDASSAPSMSTAFGAPA